ncbi:hypothetical protein ACF8C6_08840 [Pseudomonas sp. zbq_18]|uniref:hypothetical protein n=1 Tax=Pseudomonas sp. zbq_18 TaxID=3367251 RepID=UPI00370AA4F1
MSDPIQEIARQLHIQTLGDGLLAKIRQTIDLLQDAAAERDALSAQLAAIRAAGGEVVEVVGCAAIADDGAVLDLSTVDFIMRHWQGQSGYSVNPLMTVAQHQRITAAMAAELADAKSARDAYGQNAIDMQKQRDALRAELAEVKGREAVAWVNPKFLSSNDLLIYASHQQFSKEQVPLYAYPPASPDVEGLVKALEATLKLGRGTSGRIILESEDEEALRTALSTWRQAQEGKP